MDLLRQFQTVIKLENCFIDYDGDKTILVTPEKGKLFEIIFDNIAEAKVAILKAAGQWKLKNGSYLKIRYPLAYFRKIYQQKQEEIQNEYQTIYMKEKS